MAPDCTPSRRQARPVRRPGRRVRGPGPVRRGDQSAAVQRARGTDHAVAAVAHRQTGGGGPRARPEARRRADGGDTGTAGCELTAPVVVKNNGHKSV